MVSLSALQGEPLVFLTVPLISPPPWENSLMEQSNEPGLDIILQLTSKEIQVMVLNQWVMLYWRSPWLDSLAGTWSHLWSSPLIEYIKVFIHYSH